jgi:HK97 family phage major capsid protein
MNSIQALRERRNAKALEAKKLLDDHPAEKWSKEVEGKVDALYAEIDDIDAQISRHQKLLDLSAEQTFSDVKNNKKLPGAAEIDLPENFAKSCYSKWLRGGDNAISGEEWTKLRATMSTTTTTEGGYTVPTEVAKSVVEALKAFGGMRSAAEVFATAAGNDINFPTSDGTAEVGELIAQNTTATGQDPSFGVRTLSVYKYSSKIVAVPIELLQDTVIDMEAFVKNRLVTRLGRITNTHFTTGTGTGQPTGVVTIADSGKVGTTGQTLTVIYDDLIDLIHSVDPAYRVAGNCKFMMNDASVKVIRKLKDTTGRPIWTPGYETGIALGQPDTLLGYPVVVNQDIAVMAANAKSILFGDFTYYKIRDVMAISMFRFTDSAYTKLGQVGFLAWMRSGGNFVGVTGTPNAIKYYQNSAT